MTWGMINAALLFAVTPVGVASWGVQIWRAARTLKDSDKLAYRGKARLQLEASARAKTIDVFSEWLKVKIPGGQSRELRKRMAEALLDTTLCNMKVVKPEY